MARMVYAAAARLAIQTACHLDAVAHVEIENVVAVLRSLEVSHGAGDALHVELV
jgi:hypothetical protein